MYDAQKCRERLEKLSCLWLRSSLKTVLLRGMAMPIKTANRRFAAAWRKAPIRSPANGGDGGSSGSTRRLPSAACDQSAVSRLGVSGRCIAAAWRTPALKQPDAIKNGLSLARPDLTLWAALLPPAPAVIQQGAEAKRDNRRLT